MLLQLKETKKEDVQKLIAFAKQNSLHLTVVDADKTKAYLPGAPLNRKEIKELISKSRKSGTVSLKEAHKQIRKKLNGN
jgi:hypothetical protein